jgi:hypothetical protein
MQKKTIRVCAGVVLFSFTIFPTTSTENKIKNKKGLKIKKKKEKKI